MHFGVLSVLIEQSVIIAPGVLAKINLWLMLSGKDRVESNTLQYIQALQLGGQRLGD